MLSKNDIENELGKGISIYPFNHENFKENSINLCASKFAWTLSSGKVYYDTKSKCFLLDSHKNNSSIIERQFIKGKSALWKISNVHYIILLPHSTTLIETEEVISIGKNIGGTYHSKVGIVSQGIGHIGTMLGPNFTGNSLVAVHNLTNEVLKIKVGESFVSVVFHYLNTPIDDNNPTVSGHLDKMAKLGIKLNSAEYQSLEEDWRKKPNEVEQKMIKSQTYKTYLENKKSPFITVLKQYINKQNVIMFILLLVIICGSLFVVLYYDKQNSNHELFNQWWDIFKEGIIVTILITLITNIKKRN